MPRTPDRMPGASVEEETVYEDRTADGPPTVDGAVRYVSGDLVVKLAGGVFSLTSGTGSPHPVTVAIVDPTVTDDSASGFAVGHHWINTASTPPRTFQAIDVSVGAAFWKRVDNLKINITNTDPTITDDSASGYEIGSQWVNTVTDETFICTLATAGAAIWKQDSNAPGAGKQTPKEHFLDGSLLAYGAVGAHGLGASVIQYTRVWLTAGLIIDRVRVFVDSGGNASRHIRVGLYSQTDPANEALPPNNRLRESTEWGTAVTGYLDAPFGSAYVVTVTGYYWVAMVADSTSVKFSITAIVYRADFIGRRAEGTTGTILPATASGLTNPAASLVYASAVEV